MAPPPISLAASFPQNPKIHQIPISRRLSPTVGTASPSRSVSSVDSQRAKTDLLRLISDQERGLRTQTNPSKRKEIIGAIEELALHGDGTITTDSSLSCTWRMLWTTEKEQLFIIKNAWLFGTETGDVLQVIDVEKGLLNNVITFPPSGVFFVRSEIEAEPPQRVNFRFTSAVIRGSKWEIPLPPFGRGWFESVYMDEEIRVVKDIRGDYLVVDRAPYSWKE
ncbi:probable plastid-lipid-associated protein 11, chloroplastic [Dendrobium catenatum]|uniref:Putative plastid-lipid-associated protein 11, chloroplastic n=1 Tax=Dendrobium catenatum TaxID=906689 RepID=A0A2I0WVG2_9ASPA|nr:probable plastid-lipid-associated protein 11, chloroplastic [Dendrobium catenatum]PKU79655.1 putative plastid-lipid-associated protein 11, chloroplastic [Dendrobium catenatum]